MSHSSRDDSPPPVPPHEVPALLDASLDYREPPGSIPGILRRIGPGLILAGAIVGSGELIATTRVGAEAGFTLLWLIIIGCIIKVFVQIELGRHTILTGQTTLTALSTVPGPKLAIPLGRTAMRGNWITWFWLLMFIASIGQLGGIVGGVGQAMAISIPLTDQGRAYNQLKDDQITLKVRTAQLQILEAHIAARGKPADEKEAAVIARLNASLPVLAARVAVQEEIPPPNDAKIWAAILGVITSVILTIGRYRLIEVVSIVFVGLFTLVTIGNAIALQTFSEWAVTGDDLIEGFSFKLPSTGDGGASLSGKNPLSTALAAFGIIGVGASELMAYPYWCIEKGYAKWTGRADGSASWLGRARGWLRVMKWDAWCSMVFYTLATIAFYLLGAAVLNRTGLHPSDDELVRTLTGMYEPVFGAHAPVLFLTGAVAVLYSTYFAASAGNARQAADIIDAFKIHPLTETTRRRWVRFFSGFFPLACVIIFWVYPKPVTLVLISGVMQALLLPMLGIASLYFRYKKCDPNLKPSLLWDVMLWLSFVAFFIVGAYLAYVNIGRWFA